MIAPVASPARPARGAAIVVSSLAPLVVFGSGCKPYVIEYHTRPAFYHSASDQPLPDELEKADGTRIVFRDAVPSGYGKKPDSDAAPFQIREVHEDGSITLRCVLPEHVIANTMTCIRQREYELMWDQLLASATRDAYEEDGNGFEEFADFIEYEREPIMETLNRMSFGFMGQDVVLENGPNGSLQARFGPRLVEQFRYTVVEIAMDGGMLRLVTIR